jgi:hypothetical protein
MQQERDKTSSQVGEPLSIDARLTQLNEKLDERLPPIQLQETLQKQVKEHREYLESLLDRAIKVLYFIALFIVAAAGIFGFKTYWDIDERLKNLAQEQVNKYIDRDYIKAETEKRISEYNKAAIVAYLTIRASASDGESKKFSPNESDITLIRDIVSNPASPYFEDSLRIISSLDVFKDRYSNVFGPKIISLLEQQWKLSTPAIKKETQLELIDILKSFNIESAVSLLMGAIENQNIPIEIRVRAIDAIALLSTRSERNAIASKLLDKISDIRNKQRDLYISRLVSALALDFNSAWNEASKLSEANTKDDAQSFAHVIQKSLIPRTFYVGDENMRSSAIMAIARFLGKKMYFGQFHFARESSSLPRQDSGFSLMYEDSDHSATGIEFFKIDTPNSDILIDGAIQSLSLVDRSKMSSQFVKMIEPLIELGIQRFAFEKAQGLIGQNSDSFQWQDGFRYDEPELSNSEILLIGYDKSTETVLALKRKAVGKEIENASIKASQFDPQRLKWKWASYTVRSQSRF